jgi:hypothetical protein
MVACQFPLPRAGSDNYSKYSGPSKGSLHSKYSDTKKIMNPGVGATYVHPVIAFAMLSAVVLIFTLPRKHLIIPFLAAALLIPMDQVIVLGPFHFQMLRVLILFAWVRALGTGMSSGNAFLSGGMNLVDKALILWTIFTALDIFLLWQTWPAFNNQLGTLYTVLGIYLLLRFLLRNSNDVERALRALAYVIAIVAVVMVVEQATGRNPYVLFGGANEWVRQSLMSREDRFRAMGPFGHPILAGVFGATLFPLFIGLWGKSKQNRFSAGVGAAAATVITLCSNSSTPLMGYAAGILGLCLWYLRDWMRLLRWALVLTLVSLHLIMKAPVWALIGRVDVIGGNSSYHRYFLIDQCIRHFGDWWLLGTKSYAEWGWDAWDLANQYVAVAQTSGLLPLIFFIAMIVFGFRYVGRARRACAVHSRSAFYLWALGAALFAHVVSFFGISYWDQTVVGWYALFAMIPAAATVAKPVKPIVAVASASVQSPPPEYATVAGPSLSELLLGDQHQPPPRSSELSA